MRFYNQQHRFYCGVDLHARTMYVCVLDHAGNVVLHKELPAEPGALLEAIAPFRAAPANSRCQLPLPAVFSFRSQAFQCIFRTPRQLVPWRAFGQAFQFGTSCPIADLA